jgi:probable rRNA maturation factor
MIVYEPRMELKLPRTKRPRRRELNRFLRQAIEATEVAGEVSVLLAGDEAIRKLNRQYRRKDSATDVLSFPAASTAEGIAGDLMISMETALRQAEERGHTLEMEIKLLLLHGLLHLAGYDHETDDGAMRRKEMRLRRELGLSEGLIERAGLDHAHLDHAHLDHADLDHADLARSHSEPSLQRARQERSRRAVRA